MTAQEVVAVTEAGLDPQRWRDRLTAALPLDRPLVGSGGRVLVVAAHPDDEALGLGGTIQRLLAARLEVTVVVATDGEAAYGDAVASETLAATRRAELAAGLAVLGVRHPACLLGLPDGHLAGCATALRAALARQCPAPSVVLAPWTADPHPDHRAAGRAAREHAARVGCPLWEYPIWMRHWTDPDDEIVPVANRLRVLRLTAAEQSVKDAAVARHVSQLRGPVPGVGPVLPDHVLAHFTDGLEPLFAPTARQR